MSMVRRLRLMLLTGLIVFLAGTLRDVRWHATHDSGIAFESASTQAEVHWLLWVGVLVLLGAGGFALTRSGGAARKHGYVVTVTTGFAFALVSVWHFIEHANGNHPDVAHALLWLAGVGIVAGVVLTLLMERRHVHSRS